jgi:hypothetical protein
LIRLARPSKKNVKGVESGRETLKGLGERHRERETERDKEREGASGVCVYSLLEFVVCYTNSVSN